MVCYARRQRRGTRPPPLHCATTVGRNRFSDRLAKACVGQPEVVIDLEQGHLISQGCFALAEGIDPAPNRQPPLPEVEVEPLHKGRIDGPATARQGLFDGEPGADAYSGEGCTQSGGKLPPHPVKVAT